MSSAGVLGAPNPNWPGAYYVDVRDERWLSLLKRDVIPSLLASGFHGIFLDTLDSAEFLERSDPIRCGGMIQAAASLIAEIRGAFPAALIMVNRGYAILPLVPGSFDFLLGESVLSTFTGHPPSYRLVSDEDHKWQFDRMVEARRLNENLQLFSLDYWDPADQEGLRGIYARQRASGLVPYVATPDLMTIVPEP
jgi:uncharacterized protein (TIGR01370 family)